MRLIPILKNIPLVPSIIVLFLCSCNGHMSQSGHESPTTINNLSVKSGEPHPRKTPEEYKRLGDIYFNKEDFKSALVYYQQCVRLQPQNIEALYKEGLTYYKLKMNGDAIKTFNKVLERDRDHALSYEGLGLASFRMKDFKESAGYFKKAVKIDNSLWGSHNMLGILYNYEGNYEKAIEKYHDALAQQPDDTTIYNNIGLTYSLMGKNKEAIRAFNRALASTKNNPHNNNKKILNNLGITLAKNGEYQKALEAFRAAGDEAQAYNNMGWVYVQLGDTEKAIQSFEKAIELNPSYYEKAGDNLKRLKYYNENSEDIDREVGE